MAAEFQTTNSAQLRSYVRRREHSTLIPLKQPSLFANSIPRSRMAGVNVIHSGPNPIFGVKNR